MTAHNHSEPLSPTATATAPHGHTGPAVARVKSSASSTAALETTAYPAGHLGHLSPRQEQALCQFKELLVERCLLKPGHPPSHDDALLLRFLRARKWVVQDAYKQFKDTEDWRAANDIDVLYRTIELDAYEQSRRMYPQWTGRRDRRGIPLYVFEIRTLTSKAVSHYEKQGANSTFSEAKTDGKTPSGLLRLFALYENLTRFSMPFCTQLTDREHPDVPITMSTNIVDISGTGLKQFWNLKGHMQAASQLATAHYPETLDRIFIIGAPMFFSTVWGWIKHWFDPITVSKIFVLSPHEVLPTLEKFIDRANIPKRYGGDLDFSFGSLGVPDPAWEGVVRWQNGHSGFCSGPMLWEDAENGETVACIRMGRRDGKPQRETICTMPRAFRTLRSETNGLEVVDAGKTANSGPSSSSEERARGSGEEPAVNRHAAPSGGIEKLEIEDASEHDSEINEKHPERVDGTAAVSAQKAA